MFKFCDYLTGGRTAMMYGQRATKQAEVVSVFTI